MITRRNLFGASAASVVAAVIPAAASASVTPEGLAAIERWRRAEKEAHRLWDRYCEFTRRSDEREAAYQEWQIAYEECGDALMAMRTALR